MKKYSAGCALDLGSLIQNCLQSQTCYKALEQYLLIQARPMPGGGETGAREGVGVLSGRGQGGGWFRPGRGSGWQRRPLLHPNPTLLPESPK